MMQLDHALSVLVAMLDIVKQLHWVAIQQAAHAAATFRQMNDACHHCCRRSEPHAAFD
jgi:hypothetical protein